ncbi:HPr family phosphocarrier protein [Nesterenkonia sp. CF4.4]|uniref:HPr family phosphocarrier protein n=1 Tax=Nesterenkonia sp. CF4.4 TaxID=3373079 RepID=UPI003EE6CD5C
MIERTARVASRAGLHARPAAAFSSAADQYQDLRITIAPEGAPAYTAVDARSVLSVMNLGVAHGARMTLRSEGQGADAALAHLAGLLETEDDDG